MRIDPLASPSGATGPPREPTERRALARCRVTMLAETTDNVANNAMTKGDVLTTARVAGIQAAKRASDLLPMGHRCPHRLGGDHLLLR